MQRNFSVLFTVAVVVAALAAGAGCDKLRARDKLNKGVNAYKNAQFDVAIEDFKEATAIRSDAYERAALPRCGLCQSVHSRRSFTRESSQRPVCHRRIQGDPQGQPGQSTGH